MKINVIFKKKKNPMKACSLSSIIFQLFNSRGSSVTVINWTKQENKMKNPSSHYEEGKQQRPSRPRPLCEWVSTKSSTSSLLSPWPTTVPIHHHTSAGAFMVWNKFYLIFFLLFLCWNLKQLYFWHLIKPFLNQLNHPDFRIEVQFPVEPACPIQFLKPCLLFK